MNGWICATSFNAFSRPGRLSTSLLMPSLTGCIASLSNAGFTASITLFAVSPFSSALALTSPGRNYREHRYESQYSDSPSSPVLSKTFRLLEPSYFWTAGSAPRTAWKAPEISFIPSRSSSLS